MKSMDDLDHVVVHTTDMKYVWGEGPRCLEAKITKLHKHLKSTREDDDDKTAVTVITPTTVYSSSSSPSTSCCSMPTLRKLSAESCCATTTTTNRLSLPRRSSTSNLELMAAARDDCWGHFVEFDSPETTRTNNDQNLSYRELERDDYWKNLQDGALQVGGTLLGMTITFVVSVAIAQRRMK